MRELLSQTTNICLQGAALRLVHSAIRLSAHVLARDKRQLAGQLTGRLLGNPAPVIQGLLRGAAEQADLGPGSSL